LRHCTYGFIDAIEFGFLRVEPLKVDRYTKNILPSVEVHFMASGPEVVLFMTESDAASIVKLTGALHHGVTAFASSFPTIGSLVSIPINRIVSAQYRTIQFAPQDMTPALDLELQ
jgi:hypothetical protein